MNHVDDREQPRPRGQPRLPGARGRPAPGPGPLRAPHRRRDRGRRPPRRPVDHVTARRLAIWLAARPQAPVFAQSLVRFTETGAISPALKTQLRIHARSGNYPDRPQAATLMEYCVARGAALGPVGQNFGPACDQIDRADLMLLGLHDRARQGLATPSRPGPRPTDPGSSPWPTATPTATRSASSWTSPPPTRPSSPSPRTPTSAKPTSARSSSSARACPKAPTAAATAKPSPPARPGSPPACAPSNEPAGRPSNATPYKYRPSPQERSALLSIRPTRRWNWSEAPGPRTRPPQVGQLLAVTTTAAKSVASSSKSLNLYAYRHRRPSGKSAISDNALESGHADGAISAR